MERCLREIAAIENQLRAGHPDVQGLCLALADWSAELRILEEEQRQKKPPGSNPAAEGSELRLVHDLME
ncbi:MAG: hypothetical protein ABSG41_13735 [Bryobacteraceae bacterium]|jgi:hypothetical protein